MTGKDRILDTLYRQWLRAIDRGDKVAAMLLWQRITAVR